ncbi:MAG: hypothetical protein ACRDL4_09890, partial [Thermoleophilaceae bacterium]
GRERFELDHTADRLFDVPAKARRLELKLAAERGVRSGLALVARFGDPVGGSVRSKARYLRKGGRGSVTLRGLRKARRITAIVINADGRSKGFRKGEREYTRDNVRYRAKLRR